MSVTAEKPPIIIEHEAQPTKRRWRPSIAVALSFGFGGMTLLALSIVLWISYDTARDNTLSLLRVISETTLASMRSAVEQQMDAAGRQVTYMAKLVEQGLLDPGNEEQVTQTITGALAATPQVRGMALVSTDGTATKAGWFGEENFVHHKDKNMLENEEFGEQIQQEMKTAKGVIWRGVVWVEELEEPHIAVFHPLRRDGEYLGFIGAIVSVSFLSEYLEKLDKDYGSHTYILANRKRVLAHPSLTSTKGRGLSAQDPLPPLENVQDGNLRRIWDDPVESFDEFLKGSPLKGHIVETFGGEVTFLHTKFSGYGFDELNLGIYFKEDELDSYYDRLILTGIAALVITILAVVLIFLAGRMMARPLVRLSAVSEQVSHLDLAQADQLPGSVFRELDSAANAYNSMIGGLKWFETYVPKKLVKQLMEGGGEGIASQERDITVMFTDIVSFTSLSEHMPPGELAALLNHHFNMLGAAIEAEEGTIDKYIGDSIMAFWGAPAQQSDHALHACRAALAIEAALEADNRERTARGEAPIRIRIGLHSGPAVAGNIGAESRVNYTLIGDTVNTAQRLEASAKELLPESTRAATIMVSGAFAEHLKGQDGFRVRKLTSQVLRGRESVTELYELLSG